jgi:hypothetical protein
VLDDQTPPIDHTGAQWVSLVALNPASADDYTSALAHQSLFFRVFLTEEKYHGAPRGGFNGTIGNPH